MYFRLTKIMHDNIHYLVFDQNKIMTFVLIDQL